MYDVWYMLASDRDRVGYKSRMRQQAETLKEAQAIWDKLKADKSMFFVTSARPTEPFDSRQVRAPLDPGLNLKR